jgi:hypothetical protein
MRNKKYGLFASALLSSALLLPAPSANAWVTVTHWSGGCCYHPAPCYAGVACAAVAGMAVGAAIASKPAVVYAAPAPVVVVNPQPVVVVVPLAIGSEVTVLPAGVQSLVVNGTQYYQSGATWYRPYFGSNGVYYAVVSAP